MNSEYCKIECKDTTKNRFLQTIFYIFNRKRLISVGKVLVYVQKKQ